MQSHYRKNLVFSYENLDNAKISYNKLITKIATLKEGGEVDNEAFATLKARFVEAMDNDLNTSLAVTALYDVLKAKTTDATKLALFADFDRVLSLDLIGHANALRAKQEEEAKKANAAPEGVSPELAQEVEALIVERAEAKKAKNYARADEIRKYLADKGITLIDSSAGTTYKLS
jgi:cysteinyl-tRNA synthetase